MLTVHTSNNTPPPTVLTQTSASDAYDVGSSALNTNHPKQVDTCQTNSHLALWLKKLPEYELPINATVANQLIELLHDENCDAIKQAKLIKQDPMLCLHLFHYAENALKQRKGSVQHLTHLLGLLGMNSVERSTKSKQHRPRFPQGLQEILAASAFSAHLSNYLLLRKHHGNTDRFYLSTLFFNVPLWLMWVASPKVMNQGQLLASRQNQPHLQLCQQKLGFELNDLFSQIGDIKHLPDATLKALNINPKHRISDWAKFHRYSPAQLADWFVEDREAYRYFNSIEMGIFLLNQYVLAIYLDWSEKHIQRYSRLLCHYLRIQPKSLQTITQHAAKEVAWKDNFTGLLAPANRLKGLHKEPEITESKTAATQTDSKTATKNPSQKPSQKDSSTDSQSTIENHKISEKIKPWIQKIRSASTKEDAYNAAFNALVRGIGAAHCIIMHVDENAIHTHSCYGFQRSADVPSFRYQRGKTNDLFNQLTQKPACIAIDKSSISKAMRNIPSAFTQRCRIQPCGFASVFCKHTPEVLMYCDHPQWSQQKHYHFKVISKVLSHTLEGISASH